MNSFKTSGMTLDLCKRFEEMAQFPNKTVANDDSYFVGYSDSERSMEW